MTRSHKGLGWGNPYLYFSEHIKSHQTGRSKKVKCPTCGKELMQIYREKRNEQQKVVRAKNKALGYKE